MKYYDWILRYGKNQECEMRSGYKYLSEEVALKKGNSFIKNTSKFYENAKIEIIEISE